MYYVLILYRNKQRYWAEFDDYYVASEYQLAKSREGHVLEAKLVSE
jgi:hypothetical protein